MENTRFFTRSITPNTSRWQSLNGALLQATRAGNAHRVEACLSQGANPNTADNNGVTVLRWAAFFGHAKSVHWLLSYGADPRRTQKKGRSALAWAAYWEHHTTLYVLLVHAFHAQTPHHSDPPAGRIPADWLFLCGSEWGRCLKQAEDVLLKHTNPALKRALSVSR